MKKKIFVILAFGLCAICGNSFAQNATNKDLIECLLFENKQQIKSCMKEKFPRLMAARYEPYDAISISFCQSSEPEHQEFCDQIKENLNKQFEKLLGAWSYLYSQCSKGIRPEDCIAQIDISRCSESGVGKDENWVGLEADSGACYGLAAFLKKSISICENQFYYIVETNCGYWVEHLSKDCSSCNEQTFVENDQGYFNWLEGATPSMR